MRRRRALLWLALSGAAALLVIVGVLVFAWLRPARDTSPVVLSFPAGQVTQRDVELELETLPPHQKFDHSTFLHELAVALAHRRALAQAARSAGHVTLRRGALGERLLVRRLVADLGTPRDMDEAREHHRRYAELLRKALGGPITFHFDRFAAIRFDPRRPMAPPERRHEGPAIPFFLNPSDLQLRACQGVIHPDLGFYTGECTGREELYFKSWEIIWLEAVFGPEEGFLHLFAPDGRVETIYHQGIGPLGEVPLDPGDFLPEMPEDWPTRARGELWSVRAAGGVDEEAARRWFERVAAPFERCIQRHAWNVDPEARSATFTVRLELREGVVVDGGVATEGLAPARREGTTTIRTGGIDAEECLLPLTTYLLAGTGEVTYEVRLTVE